SSRFSSTLATTVHAASSAASTPVGRSPPFFTIARAAAASLRYFSSSSRYNFSSTSASASVGVRAVQSRKPWAARPLSPPASRSIRRASAADASTNTRSLSTARACNGVLVRGRRSHITSRLGASKATNSAYGAVRRQNVYRPRRYWSPSRLSTHLSALYGLNQTPSGWYGKTLGPPILRFSRPLIARALSRTASASSRKRGPRANSRLNGSRLASSGGTRDACRYAADVTMSLCI